jgi:hypothetical protein
MKKRRGHYCRICGSLKPNEAFSGKGHRNHICKKCASLPKEKREEIECLEDEDARAQRRIREAERRAKLDLTYIKHFAERIQQLCPKCPLKTARSIAEHACTKYSGRVGRSAAAKALDEQVVHLAVIFATLRRRTMNS